MNVVMTGDGRLVEVQATAERDPFTRDELDELLDLAAGGIDELAAAQRCGGRSRRSARRPSVVVAANSRTKLVPSVKLLLASEPAQAARARGRAPDWEIELLDAADVPAEDGATFVENARGKARARSGRARRPTPG